MKIIKHNLFFPSIFSFFLLEGCYTNPTEKLFEKQDLINFVRKKALLRIEKEYGLKPFGIGGQARDEVEMLALAFQSSRKIDIIEGRKLLVASVEILLDEINKEDKLIPYLANYPFEAKNVDVSIYINSSCREELAVISASRGLLQYQKDISSDEPLKTVCRETYQEALEKLRL